MPKNTSEKNGEFPLAMADASIKELEAYHQALANGEISPEKAFDDFLGIYFVKFATNIQNQVREHLLKYTRLFFIVGKNNEHVQSIATFIYSAYKWVYDPTILEISVGKSYAKVIEMSFLEQSYVGWDENEIKGHLFSSDEPFIRHFENDQTVFLRGLKDKKLLERLVDIVENTIAGSGRGILILQLDNKDSIPPTCLCKYAVIEEKNMPQNTPAKTDKLSYDDAKRILFFDNETNYRLTKKEQALVDYLKSDERDVEDICEEIWKDREARGNFDNLKSKLNAT